MEIALYTTSSIQSQVFSNDFNNILTKEMFNDYSMTKLHLIIRTFIYETGLIIGFLLLIPFQKRMILKYFCCISGGIVPSAMASRYPLIDVSGERKSWEMLDKNFCWNWSDSSSFDAI